MPARAITVYIIRLITAVAPPKAHATRSNSKSPTSPQFKAPVNYKDKANLIKHIITPSARLVFAEEKTLYI